jgi:hypothetical protein
VLAANHAAHHSIHRKLAVAHFLQRHVVRLHNNRTQTLPLADACSAISLTTRPVRGRLCSGAVVFAASAIRGQTNVEPRVLLLIALRGCRNDVVRAPPRFRAPRLRLHTPFRSRTGMFVRVTLSLNVHVSGGSRRALRSGSDTDGMTRGTFQHRNVATSLFSLAGRHRRSHILVAFFFRRHLRHARRCSFRLFFFLFFFSPVSQ